MGVQPQGGLKGGHGLVVQVVGLLDPLLPQCLVVLGAGGGTDAGMGRATTGVDGKALLGVGLPQGKVEFNPRRVYLDPPLEDVDGLVELPQGQVGGAQAPVDLGCRGIQGQCSLEGLDRWFELPGLQITLPLSQGLHRLGGRRAWG